MRILHLVPGLSNPANGIAVAAKLIAAAQGADLADCRQVKDCNMSQYDEVWVHSMWTPQVWSVCRQVLKVQSHNHTIPQSHNPAIAQSPQSNNPAIKQAPSPRLVRMTHGCLDPLRVAYHGWKKRLVAPIERRLFAKCDRVVVTGPWETRWCRDWGVACAFESIDLKQYFKLPVETLAWTSPLNRPLHLLYLGRPHPLKGLDVLNAAIAQLHNRTIAQSHNPTIQTPPIQDQAVDFRSVCDAFGDEKEKVWDWADVLVLPTLSENFGLVVAEALERGKRVITTDGAPAWEDQPGVVYQKGYRDGTDERRVELLRLAIREICGGSL